MAPAVKFEGEITVDIVGDVGIKRRFHQAINPVTICLRDQKASIELLKHGGKDIISITGNENGVVYERGSGRVFRSGESLTPPEGEKFILRSIESSDGEEICP